ncbi:MAG: hypothetical protein U0R19_36455 [Bryobacteraceae bacterium]
MEPGRLSGRSSLDGLQGLAQALLSQGKVAEAEAAAMEAIALVPDAKHIAGSSLPRHFDPAALPHAPFVAGAVSWRKVERGTFEPEAAGFLARFGFERVSRVSTFEFDSRATVAVLRPALDRWERRDASGLRMVRLEEATAPELARLSPHFTPYPLAEVLDSRRFPYSFTMMKGDEVCGMIVSRAEGS